MTQLTVAFRNLANTLKNIRNIARTNRSRNQNTQKARMLTYYKKYTTDCVGFEHMYRTMKQAVFKRKYHIKERVEAT
jgi:hypothetical protein